MSEAADAVRSGDGEVPARLAGCRGDHAGADSRQEVRGVEDDQGTAGGGD